MESMVSIQNLTVKYGNNTALQDVSLEIYKNNITALIGPSGCGKSTLLRTLNRMNDLVYDMTITGNVSIGGNNIYAPSIDPAAVRFQVGMVFQKPNPFPKSIFENVAFGPKINRFTGDLNELVKQSLKNAGLWEEVKDRLQENAYSLSGGQQQRLCIARALALKPELLLLDEPCSALDPISTMRIEELIKELKKKLTIIIVTHNMQQAARVADYTGFFLLGELIEFDGTEKIFTNPSNKKTEEYITGRFG